jgi:hypothetical protein
MSLLNNTSNTWKNIENESPPNIEEPIERLIVKDITIDFLVSSTIYSTDETKEETIDNANDSTRDTKEEIIENTNDFTHEKPKNKNTSTYNRIKQFYKLLTSCRSGSYSKV